MIVTLKMQHSVDHQMGTVRGECLALRRRFPAQQRQTKHDVAVQRARQIIVHER